MMSHEVSSSFEARKSSFASPVASRPEIPQAAYRPIKRCPSCQSVYLTDTSCEACGRSLLFHPIGEPFGAKSFYGIKERYIGTFGFMLTHFPFFENREAPKAQGYIRHLHKRFDELLLAFGSRDVMNDDERRFFYVEVLELISELLRYKVLPALIEAKIDAHFTNEGQLLFQELIRYLKANEKLGATEEKWTVKVLDYRLWSIIRVDYLLKLSVVTATVLTMAVAYYGFFSSLSGR